jgi:hypothetical protein
MPGHKVHAYLDRQLFGKVYWKLHRKMDVAVFWLGKKHRALYHDPITAVYIAMTCYPNDPNAEEAAFTHILLDEFCTAYPGWKKLLEQLAYADAKRRRRERQKNRRNRGRQQASKLREETIIRKLFEDIRIFQGIAKS